jgi:hypothetical protein
VIRFHDPRLSFVLLELVALAWCALTFRHARRTGQLLTWVTIVVYGVAMELISYNLTDTFHHGKFTVMLFDDRMPLYVVAIYPVLLYTGIAIARALQLPAPTAGVLIVLLDVPFDLAGPPLGWWTWTNTDPNLAVRWAGVPVTSFYWHLAFGAILCALTARRRPLWFAAPWAAATIALGMVAFLPFHALHALGVPDGAIVAGALAVCSAAAWPAVARRRRRRPASTSTPTPSASSTATATTP